MQIHVLEDWIQLDNSRFFWKAAIVQTAMVTSVKTRLNENDVFHKRSSVNSPRLLLLLSMLCRVPQEIQPRFWPIGTPKHQSDPIIDDLHKKSSYVHMYVPQIPNFMFWLFTFNALLSMFQKSPRYTNHQLNSQRHGHCPGRTQCVEA